MKKHIGDLIITKDTIVDFTEITGFLKIENGVNFSAPKLKVIGGGLYIHANTNLEALTTVGGHLSIHDNTNLEALTTVGGDLYIYDNTKLEALTTVGGGLYIHANTNLEALTTVGGDLSIYDNTNLEALTTVGGDLSIHDNTNLEALTTVGGGLYINSNSNLEASALTTVGGDLYIRANAKLETNNLINKQDPKAKEFCKKALEKSFKKRKFVKIDGILSFLISVKAIKNIKIFKVKIVGKLDVSFIIQKGGVYSHGKTIKEAKDSLKYKLSDRDTSEYKKWTLDTIVTQAKAIQAYRAITGACEQGTKLFCESQKLKAKYTIREVIELTEGKYKNDVFREFFK